MPSRLPILALLVALAVPPFARAQQPSLSLPAPGAPLGHRSWQAEAGLPQNSVQAILQTSDGYLWVGTQSGLARFDGVAFRVFEPGTVSGLPDLDIRALAQARDGAVWIGTHSGLVRYRDGTFRPVSAPALRQMPVLALETAPDGTVWGATEGAVLRIGADGKPAALPASIDPQSRVRALAWDSAGRLLLGTSEGLRRLRADETLGTPTLPESAGAVVAVLPDAGGAAWIGTSTGLYRIEAGTVRRLGREDGIADKPVRVLLRARNGDVWVGTWAGLFRRSLHGPERFEKADAVGDDAILSLREDREGSLWVGTERSGLHRFKQDRVSLYGRAQGLSDEFVWSVLADRQGRLWAGTDDGLLARRDPAAARFSAVESLGARILALAEDSQGALWAGTFGRGLVRRDARGSTRLTARDGLGSDSVTALCAAGDGSVWIGTAGAGLRQWRAGRVTTPAASDGIIYRHIRALALDRGGGLWIASFEGGVGLYRDGRLSAFHRSDGLAHDAILSMICDAEGSVWAGTGLGLSRFRDGKWVTYRRSDGLLDEQISGMLDDRRGNLWMSSNRGALFRIAFSELDAFARGATRKLHPVSFGAADGLRSAEGNNGTPGAVTTSDGRLWFATSKGVAAIDPDRIPRNPVAPPVAIEAVLADGRSLEPGARAPAGHGALEIHYAGLSFRIPEQVRFRYRLKGFDQDWIDAGTRRVAYYTNLPPGRFTFEVLAQNEDGVASERAASRAIALAPRFTQTAWFYLAGALIAAAAVLLAHRYRAAQLTARERLRTALTEAQLHVLRQQLRPHFLFNTLNTLLPLIEEDPELARNTVYMLGDLLRLNLKAEPEQAIALETEIEMLERYLAIERMRFRERLRVSLEIDPEVRRARVPTFLLQPLVENAIKHGIGKSPGSERISLRARRDDGRLVIEIQNDRVGPDATRPSEPEGIGLKNTRERLGLLYGSHYVLDLALNNGRATLSLELPLTFAPAASLPPAKTKTDPA